MPDGSVDLVQVADGREDQPLAVRALDRPAQDARAQLVGIHRVRKAQRLGHALLDRRAERDRRPLAARRVVAPDLPLRGRQDRLAVARPGEAGRDAVAGEALLVVALDLGRDDALAAALEVEHLEPRLRAHAPDVGAAACRPGTASAPPRRRTRRSAAATGRCGGRGA